MGKDRSRSGPTVVLTTASLLTQRKRWNGYVDGLPRGSVLLLIPEDNARLRSCLLRAAGEHARRGVKLLVSESSRGPDPEGKEKPL